MHVCECAWQGNIGYAVQSSDADVVSVHEYKIICVRVCVFNK